MEGARAAAADDVPRVAALCRELAAELTPSRGGAVWAAREARREPLEGAFHALLDTGDARLVVGTIDDAVVGFGAVRVERLAAGPLGIVTELYVEPEARGVGVGEAIAGELVAFCVAAGCTGIDAWSLPGQRATKNFLEAAGFTARLLVVHRPLGR